MFCFLARLEKEDLLPPTKSFFLYNGINKKQDRLSLNSVFKIVKQDSKKRYYQPDKQYILTFSVQIFFSHKERM